MTLSRRGKFAVAVAIVFLGACAGVLGLRRGPTGMFPHRPHVLSGINCVGCHTGIDTAGSDAPLHIPGTAQCMTCHTEPHDKSECSTCHAKPLAVERATEMRIHLKFRHDIHVKEVKGNCVRCHTEIARSDVSLLPKMATCFGCHQHKDQFKVRDCNGCHVNIRTEDSRPESHIPHGSDFLAQHATRAAAARDLCSSCHTESFCSDCHGKSVPLLAERRMFDATMGTGMHRAGFRSRHSDEARAEPGMCVTCHSESSCVGCHTANDVGPASAGVSSPHPAGWVGLPGTPNQHGLRARSNPMECAGCHSGAGEKLCVGCHRVGGVGGTPHAPGWKSNLDIVHDLPCRLCHTRPQ